jgi:hypothetical protein
MASVAVPTSNPKCIACDTTEQFPKTRRKLLVFYASNTPVHGKYNWYEFLEVEKCDYKYLQALVQGGLEFIPNEDSEYEFTAYANEMGLYRHDLGVNALAGGTLNSLGFFTCEEMTFIGNVILLDKEEEGLSAEQCKRLVQAIDKYTGQRG